LLPLLRSPLATFVHGEDSEGDHEVGALQDLFRAAWDLMTEEQKI
jgi:hypothetical protein